MRLAAPCPVPYTREVHVRISKAPVDESWVSTEAARNITAGFLVVSNLVPLAGALTLGWDVGTILYLFWLESLVVGGLNIVKMALAQGKAPLQQALERAAIPSHDPGPSAEVEPTREQRSPMAALAPGGAFVGKLFLIAFFLVHYGIFMAGHAAFLFAYFGPPAFPWLDAVLMMSLLLISHGASFVIYFLLRGEYRRVQPSEQMFLPYSRIMVMHITILIGGLLVKSLGAPILALAVMVALKTAIDLVAHRRSHARHDRALPLSASRGG